MTSADAFLIKICGVTTAADATLAAQAGAGAIGVNFWTGSKRFVGDDAAAARVLAAIPAGVLKVGVFVNASVEDVRTKIDRLGLDRVQLHGDEAPADFTALAAPILMRAVRVK
ncbi:MAG TPA: N-(5'-phosphoribosyl)anthranilate isomerase, partial [Polyangia bacterium]|nr:N-(5'-phosphoribosyl)anthranilate isomerase [Polyangia bacterium]